MRLIFLCLIHFYLSGVLLAQHTVVVDQQSPDAILNKKKPATFFFNLNRDHFYKISILQKNIAVIYTLFDERGKQFVISNEPSGIDGDREFEFFSPSKGKYKLLVERFEHPINPDSGKVNVFIKEFSEKEIALKKKIKQELEPENKKAVTTIDLDHFWEAFENLKNCKTYGDSVNSFQTLYLDHATDGLLDFKFVREFTAKKFTDAVAQNPQVYENVRQYTALVKRTVPVIDKVYERFKALYPNFKPFKVCFAIGINNTGGTVSNRFVLIGTEVTLKDTKAISETEVMNRIEGMIAHESVHTQQKSLDSNSVQCPLLHTSIMEGSCDFIGELITGRTAQNKYGAAHEKELWDLFKAELCTGDFKNWLYNGGSLKDKPGDLGYYIGYEITKEYYRNSADKKQAIIDIIEINNPMLFLEKSRYDKKRKL